jgi:hypothetical protein
MKSPYLVAILFSALVFFVLPQTAAMANEGTATRNGANSKSRALVAEANTTERASLLEEIRAKRLQALEETKTRRQEAFNKTSVAREESNLKIQQIRDERKRTTTARISNNLLKINEKWITNLNSHLGRLTEILAKLESRATEEGVNNGAVATAIARSKASIAGAQAAVDVQGEKVYIINVGDETTLGNDVSTVIRQMRADLKLARDKVFEARKSVVNVLTTLKGRIPEEPELEVTNTVAPTATIAPTITEAVE